MRWMPEILVSESSQSSQKIRDISQMKGLCSSYALGASMEGLAQVELTPSFFEVQEETTEKKSTHQEHGPRCCGLNHNSSLWVPEDDSFARTEAALSALWRVEHIEERLNFGRGPMISRVTISDRARGGVHIDSAKQAISSSFVVF